MLTFYVLSNLWWMHYKMMRSFFVADARGVALNAVLLGGVALVGYTLQTFVHMQSLVTRDPSAASGLLAGLSLYLLNLAVIYTTVVGLYVRGLRRFRRSLDRAKYVEGVRTVVRSVGDAVALVVSASCRWARSVCGGSTASH